MSTAQGYRLKPDADTIDTQDAASHNTKPKYIKQTKASENVEARDGCWKQMPGLATLPAQLSVGSHENDPVNNTGVLFLAESTSGLFLAESKAGCQLGGTQLDGPADLSALLALNGSPDLGSLLTLEGSRDLGSLLALEGSPDLGSLLVVRVDSWVTDSSLKRWAWDSSSPFHSRHSSEKTSLALGRSSGSQWRQASIRAGTPAGHSSGTCTASRMLGSVARNNIT